MRIRYDYDKIKQLIYSAIFVIVLFLSFIVIESIDKQVAVLLIFMPMVIIIFVKISGLLMRVYKNFDKPFMEVDDDKILCRSVSALPIEIEWVHIKGIHISKEMINIYVDYDIKVTWLRRLFRYYVEIFDRVYQIPNYAKKQDIEKLQKVVKDNKKEYSSNLERQDEAFCNLCCGYIVMLFGTFWAFFFETFFISSLYCNLLRLSIIFIFEILIHYCNTKSLCINHFDIGVLVRCLGFSLAVAQYILCACQIQEVVTRVDMEIVASWESVVTIGIIYVIICMLFLPRYGLGRRFIKQIVKMKNSWESYI